MHRHFYARLLRFDRPAPHARRGFTLVELLVVITIIAMLVGLLIPAVMRAREAARRTQCLNNQKQIGTAVFNYATEKNKFPPLFTLQPDPKAYNTSLQAVGWVPTMLPFLEQNPLYQAFQANRWRADLSNSTDGLMNAEVSTLICPSRNPTFSPAPLSYIVNAGLTDVYSSNSPLDYRENAVFFDNFGWQNTAIAPPAKPPVIDMAYLTKHDGNSMTLMLSENLDALDWIEVETTPADFVPPQPNYAAGNVESWWQSMMWHVVQPPPSADWGLGISPTGTLLNKNVGAKPETDWVNGRPSSNHPGGFIVTMCDGHSQFMAEEIEYRVYCLLAAPDNGMHLDQTGTMVANAKLPPNGTPITYPRNWHGGGVVTNPLTPITAADLE